MAFGFPAYHTEELSGTPDAPFREAVLNAVRALGWSPQKKSEDAITASTSINIWSWGEKVTVEFHREGATVTSRCAMFTQCVDWGRNKSNVRKFLAEIRKQKGR
jgi:hypothetical protein